MSKYTNPPKGGDLVYFINCVRAVLGLDPLPDVTDRRADPDRRVLVGSARRSRTSAGKTDHCGPKQTSTRKHIRGV